MKSGRNPLPWDIDPRKPLFNIGTVAGILGTKPRMLRLYEERGLITPSRTEGNRRLYSLKDIDLLAYIHYLSSVKRVNLAGIQEILTILERFEPAVRERFLSEIEQTIATLPEEKQRAFSGKEQIVAVELVE